METQITKVCSRCNTTKVESDFSVYKQKRKDGSIAIYPSKICRVCLNRDRYLKRKANPDSYAKMRERWKRAAKKKYLKNPKAATERLNKWLKKKIALDEFKDMWLLNKYGITIEQYNQMRESQNFACKICGKTEEQLKYLLHVDHCHTTGKVRHLLCVGCNTALGKLETVGIDSFINYLKM